MGNNTRQNIDLHIHSTASDGTCTPSEILELARSINLRAISITDHDTIDGSKKALEINNPEFVELITGIEISSDPPSSVSTGSFHILGYSIDLNNTNLNNALKKIQAARAGRNPKIIECLNNLDINITLEQVEKIAGTGLVGRPHIAQAMVENGYTDSIQEAFDLYLKKGKNAYVDKYRISCEEAVKLINEAGGVPVLAHPYLLEIEKDEVFETLLEDLIKLGLKGIEVFYPLHSQERTQFYKNCAEKYNLLITGGTDFHGSLKPKIKLGTGLENQHVPYKYFEQIVEATTNN